MIVRRPAKARLIAPPAAQPAPSSVRTLRAIDKVFHSPMNENYRWQLTARGFDFLQRRLEAGADLPNCDSRGRITTAPAGMVQIFGGGFCATGVGDPYVLGNACSEAAVRAFVADGTVPDIQEEVRRTEDNLATLCTYRLPLDPPVLPHVSVTDEPCLIEDRVCIRGSTYCNSTYYVWNNQWEGPGSTAGDGPFTGSDLISTAIPGPFPSDCVRLCLNGWIPDGYDDAPGSRTLRVKVRQPEGWVERQAAGGDPVPAIQQQNDVPVENSLVCCDLPLVHAGTPYYADALQIELSVPGYPSARFRGSVSLSITLSECEGRFGDVIELSHGLGVFAFRRGYKHSVRVLLQDPLYGRYELLMKRGDFIIPLRATTPFIHEGTVSASALDVEHTSFSPLLFHRTDTKGEHEDRPVRGRVTVIPVTLEGQSV